MAVIVMAHHTPDLYGSDRQLLESVTAFCEAGHQVVVTMPADGPLSPLLRERGAEIELLDVPVLRKALLTPAGLVGLAIATARSLWPAVRLLRRRRAGVVYVNTLILPFWLLAARLARVPSLCHVHEAHTDGRRIVRMLLMAPLALATRVVANSAATQASLVSALPRTGRRAVVVPNGVPGPPEPSGAPPRTSPAVLALVGRLSPNKGVDVAVEAVAILTSRGYDVELHVAGSVFPGYEWYQAELERRASSPDVAGRVRLLGYVHPTWLLLEQARVVLVPSRLDSFGNAAAEAQLAGRPVVASRVQGLPEVVRDGVTGTLVPPEDPAALADAVAALLDDPAATVAMGEAGRRHAAASFGVQQYREQISQIGQSLLKT